MSLAVHLRSAVCLLGRFPALAGVDLDVRAGEVVLLAGPNGAGKTTLLRACAGLVPVVDGKAVVLGHDLRVDRRSVRRHLGLVGHATSLYD
ncbi:MAG: ATP-binding cassette domain-containing protein, partial [Acidimicrobiales bacterium]